MAQIVEDRECTAAIFAGSEHFRRLYQIDQMMRDPALLGDGNLGRANIEVAVHLRGIANQDFAAKLFRRGESRALIFRKQWDPRITMSRAGSLIPGISRGAAAEPAAPAPPE